MILAILKVMTLRLFRDRGALLLAFVLPGFIFAIFAAIFSTASGGDLDLRVALAVTSENKKTQEVAKFLQQTDSFSIVSNLDWSEEKVRESVRLGTSDAGIILRGALTDQVVPPILIIEEPSRQIAATVLMGQLRQLLAEQAPGVLVRRQAAGIEAMTGPFSAAQKRALDHALNGMKKDYEAESDDGQVTVSQGSAEPENGTEEITPVRLPSAQPVPERSGEKDSNQDGTINASREGDGLFARASAVTQAEGPVLKDASVAYYAGATAILFLLFSAMQGAAISLEERNGGIADRLLIGLTGTAKLTLGKFLFLAGQGMVQALVVVAVAAIVFDVPVLDKLPLLVLASFSAAASAAGIALFMASLCTSATQLNTVSTFLVLIFSAIGGSMVPSFMMPDWLQSLGHLTPNAWVIDSFYGILARQFGLAEIFLPSAVLIGVAALCLASASFISYRLMRL